MTHPLNGACEKLRRAETQLAEIDKLLTSYRPPHDYNLVQDRDLDKPFHLFHLKVYNPPPRDLAPAVGEFVHNLRSALNRPLWELSRASGQNFDERDIEFPIFREEKPGIWKRVRALADDDARAIVRGLQPYHRGDRAYEDLLWLIHRLNGLDKYQIDHGLGCLVREIIGEADGQGIEFGVSIRSFEDNTPFHIPKLPLPVDMKHTFDFTIGVAIPDSEREGRGSFVPREFFHAMYEYSRGIVLSFERFF